MLTSAITIAGASTDSSSTFTDATLDTRDNLMWLFTAVTGSAGEVMVTFEYTE